MYESFFGLRERPFSAAPVAHRFFAAASIEAARHDLARCIQRASGVGIVVGATGTGKSLLCQVLAEQFRGPFEVAMLCNGRLSTRRALLQAILFELGLPYRGMAEGELRLALVDHMSPRRPVEQQGSAGLLLIVDEAHTLPLRLLEELRLITNMARNGQPRVRLVLAGCAQLEERLTNPRLEAFSQRIAARTFLEALDRQQTIEYVKHHMQWAGGAPDSVFATDALESIYQVSGGVPRIINQVCDHAMLLGFAAGHRQVNGGRIEEAWSDLQRMPASWNATNDKQGGEQAAGVIEFGELDDASEAEIPAAVPFCSAKNSSDGPATVELRSHRKHVERDYEPLANCESEVELVLQPAANAIDDEFDEEEIVIDRYTSLEIDALANRPRVRSIESRAMGSMLAACTPPVRPAVAFSPACPSARPTKLERPVVDAVSEVMKRVANTPSPAAEQLIVVEGSPEIATRQIETRVQAPYRRRYRRLFANLQNK